MSTLALYDSTTDPIVYLTNYNIAMKIVHDETDEVRCLAFPMTLFGRATTWFAQLKPGSIDSFKELSFAFTNRFISSKRKKAQPNGLVLDDSRVERDPQEVSSVVFPNHKQNPQHQHIPSYHSSHLRH